MLVLSKDCRFCDESVDFYKKLISDTKGKNVNIVAALPQEKKAAEEWINGHGIQGIEVRQSQLNSLDVSGTPTLIILNNKGEVSDFWIGKLSAEKELEVINKLNK